MNNNKQQGFTLIELIMVIVILGILAAVAIPKFVDVSAEAKQAAIDAVAGGANSAMAVNYAGCLVNNNTAAAGKCVKVTVCSDIKNLLQGGAFPSGYTLDADSTAQTVNGTNFSCGFNNTDDTSYTSSFMAIAAGISS